MYADVVNDFIRLRAYYYDVLEMLRDKLHFLFIALLTAALCKSCTKWSGPLGIFKNIW